MAKQKGQGTLSGKIGSLVYYQSRIGGDLVRKVAAGMSERVKTAPEYANTRLNASEFGGAGKAAGAIISPITQRWRYILNPIATGILAKTIREAMLTDTANPWGEREIPLTAMAAIQDEYNMQSKNDMPQLIVNGLATGSVNAAGTEWVPTADDVRMDADFVNRFTALGAEGVIVNLYSWQVAKPTFDPASGKYIIRGSRGPWLVRSLDSELAVTEPLLEVDNIPVGGRQQAPIPQNASSHLGGALVVLLPYKVVSNQKYILQEHCAAYWHTVADAEE